MKILAVWVVVLVAFAGACTNPRSNEIASSFADQTIEYQVQENQYAVVIVEDEGITAEQAKKLARQKAAEITVQNGGRYFTIVSEQPTQVIKSEHPWPDNQAFPQNMYQELIIEKNFNRQRLQQEQGPSENLYNAYRLVFNISEKESRHSIDACTLTKCK